MTFRIGLIGSGYMGRAHAIAFRAASAVFDLPVDPELEVLADIDAETARSAAASLGFTRSTGDWRQLVADPLVDLVDITTPNIMHVEMASAAIDAGKHVYCEKPLAPTAAEARPLVEAAEAAGVLTMVGLNYLKNPITALAKEIIDSGEIGEVFAFRGAHFEDYMLDPSTLVSPWRFDPRSGDGVVADLGSHIVSIARYLLGPIVSVAADRRTVIGERTSSEGETMTVEVADEMDSLMRFASGATGTVAASWIATGRKMALGCEVRGTEGALVIDFERLNELQLYTTGQPVGREGFTRILAGPAHKDYASFVPAPGHQLGFNDLKAIEVRDLVEGIASPDGRPWPDFREAWEVQRVIDAIIASDGRGAWFDVDDVD
ncbi:MAG: Gfo/Idh/MocA family oxidoreductase [Acidimicrobiia bacterium]|nr:Gfo/Idh/MocA family oxidoreductase [Acidimicrobiia bacterium]